MSGVSSAQPERETSLDAFVAERLAMFREHRLERVTQQSISALTLDEAYTVQSRFLAARVAAGERIVGWKIGCTSPAIQQQFGLAQPISGRLTEPYIHPDGVVLSADKFVDCAVEAELVFRMGRDIAPEMNDEELRAAIASVHPGIELHNYRFWYGAPTSQELISSNGIHAGLVIGVAYAPAAINLNAERMQVLVNGRVEAEGVASDVMGGPLISLRWLAQHALAHGEQVRAGDLVIPGSAVKLVRVSACDQIEARFSTVGSCRARLT